MTTIINASTSSGLVATPDNSGAIALQNNGTTGLNLTAAGYPLTPLRPAFNVSSYNINGIVSSGNYVLYGTIYTNIGSCYSAATGKFTAPVAGLYQFNVNIYSNSSIFGSIRMLVNDSNNSGGGPLLQCAGSTAYPTFGLSMAIYLNAADVIGIKVVNGSIYTDGDCRFSGFLVG